MQCFVKKRADTPFSEGEAEVSPARPEAGGGGWWVVGTQKILYGYIYK